MYRGVVNVGGDAGEPGLPLRFAYCMGASYNLGMRFSPLHDWDVLTQEAATLQRVTT
jgi:hypothetical protein